MPRTPRLFRGRRADLRDLAETVHRTQAVITFAMDGTILSANDLFLATMGYRLAEIEGRHHGLFVDEDTRRSPAYAAFWEALNRGEEQTAEVPRRGRDGRTIWLQATYSPVLDGKGRPVKVIKTATDITARKLAALDHEGQVTAIRRSQAVIEFAPDGTILTANDAFLRAMGYDLAEVEGRHHRLFVEPAVADGADYAAFWDSLRRGEHQTAEFRRLGKGGREVWIQATYTPITDDRGSVLKVVKFATDITAQVHDRQRRGQVQDRIDDSLTRIRGSVAEASAQATASASATVQSSSSVQAVAAGTEQLAASIAEIARQVTTAQDISRQAVGQADHTTAIVGRLSDAARRIGEVVTLITDVACQTNLLALNATIEAARAGDAGKGFAVVANEVKALAGQTARATDEIAQQIAGVQATTQEAVSAIAAISGTIGHLSEISATIAGAVAEQEAVTQDISANMQSTAQAVDEISANMTRLADITARIDAATSDVKAESRALVA